MNIAIILSAGKSQRTGRVNKIFYPIKGRPLIFYTILAFEKHSKIQKIILVTRKNDFRKFSDLIRQYRFQKIEGAVEGGKERQDSAHNGFKMAEILGAKKGDLILFHNAANPLVSQKEISNVILAARKYGAALLAQPLKDTLKKTKNNFVKKTISRENFWLAQTPQVIEFGLAKKAFEKPQKDKFLGADDVSLVERLGKKVRIVKTSYQNIKATTIDDLEIIKHLLCR